MPPDDFATDVSPFFNWLAAAEAAVEVPAGAHENVVSTVAGTSVEADYRLAGDPSFGWLTDDLSGTIDLNGQIHPLMDTSWTNESAS